MPDEVAITLVFSPRRIAMALHDLAMLALGAALLILYLFAAAL